MENLHKMKELLERELDGYCKRGELSAGSLDVIHKITDTIKNIDKIMMLEGGEYSRGGGRPILYDNWDSYAGPRAGTHYVAGYYRRDDGDGYTREDGRDVMRRRIHEMMDGANEKDREALRRCLEAMN